MKLPPDLAAKIRRLAGKSKPSAPPAPAPTYPAGWRLIVRIPSLVVVSEANRRDYWTVRQRRAKDQAAAVALALETGLRVPLPVRVTLVRIGGKPLDKDNLGGSFKAVQDAVARHLSVDDGDTARVDWRYCQRPGGKVRGVVIVVRPGKGVAAW